MAEFAPSSKLYIGYSRAFPARWRISALQRFRTVAAGDATHAIEPEAAARNAAAISMHVSTRVALPRPFSEQTHPNQSSLRSVEAVFAQDIDDLLMQRVSGGLLRSPIR